MKLHKFAAIILIKAATSTLCRLYRDALPPIAPAPLSSTVLRNPVHNLRIRTDAKPVVEIEKHGWTLSSGDEEILELSHGVWADHVALVAGEQVTVDSFSDENVEVIKPEVSHYLLQLALAVGGTQNFRFQQFIDYYALRFVEGH